MRLTHRDKALLEDIALHQVMTRSQLVRLGYFGSVARANSRLLALIQAGLLRRLRLHPGLETRQHLYVVSREARPWLDPRVGTYLCARKYTPTLVDHVLAVTETRLKLLELGLDRWLAEPQIRHRYSFNRHSEDFRPDGLALLDNQWLFIEVDRGHVSLPRIKEKFRSYGRYIDSGLFTQVYGALHCSLLMITTGRLRQRHLQGLAKHTLPVTTLVTTFSQFQALTTFKELWP